jgi:hypothetical protein
MLYIHSRLSLHDKTDQTQAQKERRVSIFLPRRQLRLRIGAATPHRAPPREQLRAGLEIGGIVARAAALLVIVLVQQRRMRLSVGRPVQRGAAVVHVVCERVVESRGGGEGRAC